MKRSVKNALSALMSIASAAAFCTAPLYAPSLPEVSASASMSIYIDGAQAVAGQEYQLRILVKNPAPVGHINGASLSVPNGFSIKEVHTESPVFNGIVSGKVSGNTIDFVINGTDAVTSSNIVAYVDLDAASSLSAGYYMFQWTTNSPQVTDPYGNKIACAFSSRAIQVLPAGSPVAMQTSPQPKPSETTTTTTTTTKTTTTTTTTSTTKATTTTSTTRKTKNTTTTTSTTAKPVTTTATSAPAGDKVHYGDANCDGTTDISDAVLILQVMANPEKYPITSHGVNNGDVCQRGDGLTSLDALSIQKYEAKSITVLPESYKK